MKCIATIFIVLLFPACTKEHTLRLATANPPLLKNNSIIKDRAINEPITVDGTTCNGVAVEINARISYFFVIVEKSNGNYRVMNHINIRGDGYTASGQRVMLQGHGVNTLSFSTHHTIGHFSERTVYKTLGSDGGTLLSQFVASYDAATDEYTFTLVKTELTCK